MSDIKIRLNEELEQKIRNKAQNESKTINTVISELCEVGLAVSDDRTYAPELIKLIRNEIRIEASNLYSMLVEQLSDTEMRIDANTQVATSASLANLIAGAEAGDYIEDVGTYQLAGSYVSYGDEASEALDKAKSWVGSREIDEDDEDDDDL